MTDNHSRHLKEKRDGSFDVILGLVMAAGLVHHWDGSL